MKKIGFHIYKLFSTIIFFKFKFKYLFGSIQKFPYDK